MLNTTFFRHTLASAAFISLTALPLAAQAGGVALGSTRIIYPAGAPQSSLSITNSDKNTRYLIQSWAEDANGKKTEDFVITPPLFAAKPLGENTLRIMYVGAPLPEDRESVYWMNVKAIPAVDKDSVQNKSVLQLAVLSRIKMFIRPANLPTKPINAPAALRFHHQGDSLTITNPTPYFVTLVSFSMGAKKLPNTMVSPKATTTVELPGGSNGEVTFQTINDYGAVTPKATGTLQ